MNRIASWSAPYVLAAILVSIFAGPVTAGEGEWTVFSDGNPSAAAGVSVSAHQRPQPPTQGRGTATVQAPPLLAPAPGNPVAVISTSAGDITIELFKDRAPVSVENFLQYARAGFYEGTIFHRVIPKFMAQGGGFTADLVEKTTGPPIANEAANGLRNTRGTLGMARMSGLRTATSQFYINVADNAALDHRGYSPAEFGYAVFGRVLSGMGVVDRIAAMPTKSAGGMDDVPVEPVVIKSVAIK